MPGKMIHLKKILYATDFSESSVPACDYARYFVELTGAGLHILHVLGELADSRKSMIMPESFEILEREVEIQAIRQLHDFCQEKFGTDIPYTSEVLIGPPFREIIDTALGVGADLIVMGTHGRTGLESIAIGSTAERVVRRSPVPVLTIRGE